MEKPDAVHVDKQQPGTTLQERTKIETDATTKTATDRSVGNVNAQDQPPPNIDAYWLTQHAWSVWGAFQNLASGASSAISATSTVITNTASTIATTGTMIVSSAATLAVSPWNYVAGANPASEPKSLLAPILESLKTKSWEKVFNKTPPLGGSSFSCDFAVELKVEASIGKLVEAVFKYAIYKQFGLYPDYPDYHCFFCPSSDSIIMYYESTADDDGPTLNVFNLCDLLTSSINDGIKRLTDPNHWDVIARKEDLLRQVQKNPALKSDGIPPLLSFESGKQILHWNCKIESEEKAILLYFFKKLKAEGRLEASTTAYTFSTLPHGIYVTGKNNYAFITILKLMRSLLSIPDGPETGRSKTQAAMNQEQANSGELADCKSTENSQRHGVDATAAPLKDGRKPR